MGGAAGRAEVPFVDQPSRPSIAVLFERVLGGAAARPMFGPDGSVTVGSQQWTRDGRYLGRLAWAVAGQIRPIAVTGSIDHRALVAIGWSDLDGVPAARTPSGGDLAWLVAADPTTTRPASAISISHPFLDDGFELSPNGTALVASEGDAMVVRALPSGAVLARAPIGDPIDRDGPPVACWVDDARIAWTARDAGVTVLRTLTIRSGGVSSVRLAVASSKLWCDPSGGAASVAGPAGTIALIDLTTGAPLASVSVPDPGTANVAVGAHGRRIAIATDHTLTLYQRDGARLSALLTRAVANGPALLQFSPDGDRLAVATTTLAVIGPAAQAHDEPPAPHLAFELPKGFVAVPPGGPEQQAWRFAQLPAPSGLARLPALLVNAVGRDAPVADVMALALDRDELPGLPEASASDVEIRRFALSAMARLFHVWIHATIGTERDARFTLRVGRTNGMPWFETRELVRDGCEPYDGYTRVVVDREVVFVIRALTVPNGSIDGWLARFFDLPFGVHTKTARRAGPKTGPC